MLRDFLQEINPVNFHEKTVTRPYKVKGQMYTGANGHFTPDMVIHAVSCYIEYSFDQMVTTRIYKSRRTQTTTSFSGGRVSMAIMMLTRAILS